MSYQINGKNRSVERLMVRGKDIKKAPPRMKYTHVSPKGTTVITPTVIARVSLPHPQPTKLPIVMTQDVLDTIQRPSPESPEVITLPEGEPAVDGPRFMVPKTDGIFWEPNDQQTSFIVNADMLRKVLAVASEVCEDSDKVTRIRYDKMTNSLRFDTFRMPGQQEFTAVMKCMKYTGPHLPGDANPDAPKVNADAKPEQQNLVIKIEAGRRFRGEGE